jgi:galactokinase
VTPLRLPDGLDVVVQHSGQQRTLVGSAYAERRQQCEAASAVVGNLGRASADTLTDLHDPLVRRRARHVVSENGRVRAMIEAFNAGDIELAGSLLNESHRSLAEDFEVSTPALDSLVEHLTAQPGVFGARLTGAGFGGCVIAFCESGALAPGPQRWIVRPAGGADVRIAAEG